MSQGTNGSESVLAALKSDSELRDAVQPGQRALEKADRKRIDSKLSGSFADSLDIDEAFREEYPNANRWDYLLGYVKKEAVVGLEPHSAKDDQVSTVIAKRKQALNQLRPHLADGKRVAAWYWVTSGSVQFANTERTARRLEQNGIVFAGRTLRRKHLDQLR